jgi:DNA primase catalytic subunit
MEHYQLPEGMRYSTLEERKEFYNEEFSIEKLAMWLGKRMRNIKFAVIIGRHTRIFPEEYREDADTTIIIDEYTTLNDVCKHILDFQPESAYYDRILYDKNNHKIGQELAFDLDPENVTCPIHGSLADKIRSGQGLSFCTIELGMVKQQALALHEYLEKEFSNLRIVYSGRGFHIHVFDETSYTLDKKKRRAIARNTKEKGFAIDEWVTSGEMRLIRLPYSLHGMVSRVVLPLEKTELERFDPIHDERCIPRFLRDKTTFSSF